MLYPLIVFVLVTAQLTLPKRFAFLPLVVASLQLGNAEILPQLTPARLLILTGLVRAVAAGSFRGLSFIWLDKLLIVFGAILLVSTIGHSADEWTPSPFNARIGLTLNILGSYFFGRVYLNDLETIQRYILLLPFLLLPLSVLMTRERVTLRNPYYSVGAFSDEVATRDGKVRSRGPFRHAILAGSAGATLLPFMLLLWRGRKRVSASIGFVSCVLIVITSASSGPLAVAMVALGCGAFWRWRSKINLAIWGFVGMAVFYSSVSGRGPWYLMARIDLVGGSTGWHRAYLIDQGVNHLNEWWLWGTDYTRHWMPTGVSWNPNMSDITNYYLHIGVHSGVFAVLVLTAIIWMSIRRLLAAMATLRVRSLDPQFEFLLGMVGVSLLSHAISFISISYFDQMYVFFYLLLAMIPALLRETEALVTHSDSEDSGVVADPDYFRHQVR